MQKMLDVDEKNALDYFFKLQTYLLKNKTISNYGDANDIIIDFDSISIVLFSQILEFLDKNEVSKKINFYSFFF